MCNRFRIRIIDFVLIQIISIIIVALFNFKNINLILSLSIEDDRKKIFIILIELVSFIILAIKYKLTIEYMRYKIIDFRDKLNIKEIIGRYFNSLILTVGFTILFSSIILIFYNNQMNNFNTSQENIIHIGNLLINFICVVIIGPILEEIIFRKILFIKLSSIFSINFSMVLSSVIFGLCHNIQTIISAGLFGAVLCTLYIKYKNILIPIFLHFINNIMSMILTSTKIKFNTNESFTYVKNDIYLLMLIGMILVIISIYFYTKFFIKNKIFIYKDKKAIDN